MIKLDIDTSVLNGIADEIANDLQAKFRNAIDVLMAKTKDHANDLASQKLKAGLQKWKDGFKIHKVDDDMYVISVEGQLANWMEDGIKPGEISEKIMAGNRANANKAEGKDYVDVPIAKDADSLTVGGKTGPKISVQAFANAEQMMKNINASAFPGKGIKKKQVIQSRVQDIIKNVQPSGGSASYMTIRRVSEKSKWPESPFAGAKVLDSLDDFINQNLDSILGRLL